MTTELNGNILVTVSISGELVSQLYITNSGISISPVISGEMFSPLHYDCEGGDVLLPIFSVDGTGLAGFLGVADISLPLITVDLAGSVSPIGTGTITLPGLSVTGVGSLSSTGTASINIPLLSLQSNGLLSIIGTLNSSIPTITVEATGLSGLYGTLDKPLPMFSISGTGIISVNGIGSITLPSILITSTGVFLASPDYLSMVMNIRNKALTLYNNYKFNSFCRFNGKHFGATSTEIFDLDTGTTDDGTNIEWNFRLPYVDLEQKNKNKLLQAWLSFSASGDIIVTVIQANGEEYEYDIEGVDSYEEGLRIKFGKGIRSKYITIDFKSVDGGSASIDVLKLMFNRLPKVR
jgi:hypothetical protein